MNEELIERTVTESMRTKSPDRVETYEPIEGIQAAGPAEMQRVHVLKIGDPNPGQVLVLLGGREGAANIFRSFSHDLTSAVPGLQVWAVDRREQNLADLDGFTGSPQEALGYYQGGKYRRQDFGTAPYAAEWGLSTLVHDLREVVRAASDGGRRKVVLGGVSVGANAVLSYAAWDFDGEAGYRDLAGLVIADGGMDNAYEGAGMEFNLPLDAAKGWLAKVEDGAVFENATSTGVGLGENPEDASIWYQLAAKFALADPTGPSALADRLPAELRPHGQKMTNRGLFGWLVDAKNENRHPSYTVHAGKLSDKGDWVDGGPTSLQTVMEAFAGPRPGAWVWYTLNRLMLDYVATIGFAETEVTRFLNLPIRHSADIDIPMYAFESGLAGGTVGQAAHSVAARTRMPKPVVESDSEVAHQDLAYARFQDNKFARGLADFLTSTRS
jgi:hypothetical protein